MSTRTDVLAQEASAERDNLMAAFDALEREVTALADWRAYVRREPVLTLGIAALGGAILGAASAPRRSTMRATSSSTLREAGGAVAGHAASAAFLQRAGGFLLDLVAARALAAFSGASAASPSVPNRRAGRASEAPERRR